MTTGFMTNSGRYEGLTSLEGKEAIADDIERKGWGRRTISYRIRDWLISRQRYWGTPIPIVYCDECGIVPVPEEDLPVLLPPDAEFKPNRRIALVFQFGIRQHHLSPMRGFG